uniref:EOG090X049L n=1 Tax=Simocephalus serrulatus TaxID=117539 RepID=A0A4Y7NLN9_9CRUS|nr:EOG090X049L [Simocephalus serrulatus]SVE94169.1 EOG090X049L [Simocephalus serrulatus]
MLAETSEDSHLADNLGHQAGMGSKEWILVIFISVLTLDAVFCTWNPYQVLGLTRTATIPDIRKAYKSLAKEWHPDKNKNENAEAKFVEVNKAYELLSDPARKKLYDQKGVIDDSLNRNSHPQNAYDGSGDGPSFFSQHGGFRFQFKMSEMNFFHQHRITMRAYENLIFPQSLTQPYLVLVYSEWCLMCLHLLPMWQRLVDDLSPIGINLATVHFDQEVELAHKLGGRRGELPHVVLVMESRISYFKDDEFSTAKVIEFIRSRFARNLISSVDAENSGQFLSGWKDNKVRVLLFGKLELVRLRYLTLAFKYRSHAVFGYVQLNQEPTRALSEKFDIPSKLDSLLLFHEDRSRPVARLSMADLPYSTLKDIIDANKYLQLPRLSSQKMLDSLCPPESSNVRRRLCAILVTDDLEEDEEAREHLRQFTRQFKYSRDRIVFSYVFRDKQIEFLRTLSQEGKSPSEAKLYVVIVWRQDIRHLSYSWLSQPFVSGTDNWNSSIEHLHRTLTKILGTSQPLAHQTIMKELVDEHAQGLIGRITARLVSAAEVLGDHITRQEVLAVGSVVGTVLFIAAVGYVMTYLVRLEEETVQRNNRNVSRTQRSTTTELKLHELRSETYNGMVRLLKPGCRTVVLLLDNQSKDVLIPKFHKAVWPYRKNKSLLFGWMNVDRGLPWYGRLLNLALKNVEEEEGSEMTLDSNLVKSKNCVGTVISLNGHRRYFCIYHARHPECLSGSGGKRMQSMARRLTKSNHTLHDNSGAFMGFDTLLEDSDNSDVEKGDTGKPIDEEPLITNGLGSSVHHLSTEFALDGLSNWLDRLFEGTTQRYYINYWPDFGNY